MTPEKIFERSERLDITPEEVFYLLGQLEASAPQALDDALDMLVKRRQRLAGNRG